MGQRYALVYIETVPDMKDQQRPECPNFVFALMDVTIYEIADGFGLEEACCGYPFWSEICFYRRAQGGTQPV